VPAVLEVRPVFIFQAPITRLHGSRQYLGKRDHGAVAGNGASIYTVDQLAHHVDMGGVAFDEVDER
jgi:hypothetical protein